MFFVTRLCTLQVILRRLFEQAGGRGAGVEEREDPREGVVKVAIKLLEAYTEHVPPPVCTCRHNAHVTEAYCGAKWPRGQTGAEGGSARLYKIADSTSSVTIRRHSKRTPSVGSTVL